MEVVYLVKFQHVNKVYSDELAFFYLYRMMHIVVRNSIHCIEVIFSIKVRIKAVHYHDHFVSCRPRGLGIDYVYTIQTMRNVLLKRSYMAVIWVHSKSLSVKFVSDSPLRINDFKHPIHLCLVDTVRMYRMRL